MQVLQEPLRELWAEIENDDSQPTSPLAHGRWQISHAAEPFKGQQIQRALDNAVVDRRCQGALSSARSQKYLASAAADDAYTLHPPSGDKKLRSDVFKIDASFMRREDLQKAKLRQYKCTFCCSDRQCCRDHVFGTAAPSSSILHASVVAKNLISFLSMPAMLKMS